MRASAVQCTYLSALPQGDHPLQEVDPDGLLVAVGEVALVFKRNYVLYMRIM